MQFNEEGGLLDTVLQFAVPMYGVMRNIKAMEDPAKYGRGTTVGMFTNYGQSPASLGNFANNMGNNLGFGDGGFFGGQPQAYSPYTSGYGVSDGGFMGTGFFANTGSPLSINDELSFTDPNGGGYTYGGDVSIGGGGYSVDVGEDDDVGVASY